MMKRVIALVLVIAAILLAGCSAGAQETGTLEGRVTIGPISPVQRPGEVEIMPPEVYAARKVIVYDRSGKKLLETIDLSNDSSYKVSLKPGVYTVDINRIGIDRSGDVPKQIEIRANETVLLNIDIDTGIR